MIAASLLLAEASKTPFYIVAGLLVVWAVVLAALGLARGSFSTSRGTQAGVMAVSMVLALGSMVTGVATASRPAHGGKAELKPLPAESAVGTAAEPDSGSGSASGSSSSSSSGSSSSSSGASSAKPTATVKLAADPSALKFDTTQLTAKAGTVTIDFDNPSPIGHDVRVEKGGKELGGTKVITHTSATAKLKLAPGTYTFFCSVPGHRQAGMQGTLTVK